MHADGKRNSAKKPAPNDRHRFVAIEPLESRLFCDHGLAAAISSPLIRSQAREATAASGGTTFAKAQNIGVLSQTTGLHGTLSAGATSAYFKFSVTQSCTLGLSLTALTGNADLQLFSAIGNTTQSLATSAHAGTTNESIGRKIGTGTYYVRVYETGGNAGYTLTLAASLATTKTPPPPPPPTGNLHIVFNYSYDTSGFFAKHPEAEALLTQAASAFSRFTNVLTAITPGNGNTWSETFADPANPSHTITLNNQSIASNTIVIYVGASTKLQTSELGYAAPGGWSATGTLNWLDTVEARGQAGALKDSPTGFGPWGGSISFSSTTNWNLSTALPMAKQDDFLSVATHEISHVLGFGTADSWQTYVSGNTFVGPHSEAADGGKAVPLAPGDAHWADDFKSTVNGISQYAEMDPYLITGTRRAFTALDYAGLEDLGWTI